MTEEEREAHEKLVIENKRLEDMLLNEKAVVENLNNQLEVKTKMLDKYVNLLIRVIEKFV